MQFKFRQFPTWVTQHTVCTANTEPEHNEPRKRPECEFSITRIAVRQSEGRATKWHDCVHDRPDRQRQRRHKHRTSRHPWLTNTESLACVCVLTERLACECVLTKIGSPSSTRSMSQPTRQRNGMKKTGLKSAEKISQVGKNTCTHYVEYTHCKKLFVYYTGRNARTM